MASGLLLPSSFGIYVILAGLGQYVPRRKRWSKPLIFSSSCSPQLAFVTRSMPTALFPSRCRNCSFSMLWSMRCPRLLNTTDLSLADFSPMRSSFVNHDCPSLLSTVIVSLLRSICLPALRSTVITRFITTMADSDFRKFVFAALCLALVPQIPCSCGKFPDLLCSVAYLCKLADACAPGGWFPLAYRQCGLRKPVACQLSNLSASTICSISGVSRSPFGFG